MSRRGALALGLALTAAPACDRRPSFSPEDIDAAVLGKSLAPGFLLGTATASHQVEGNNENDWTDWEAGSFPDGTPHIAHGERSGVGPDTWNRFDQDLTAMRALGVNAYRFSVEWSRIQPSEEVWRDDVVARYRLWLDQLQAAGITPLVTLYHFTLPRWVAARGGWESEETTGHFVRFTARLAQALGDRVDWWCTINEPNVLAFQGYLDGTWPPGKKDTAAMARVLSRLLEAHARAAGALRENDLVDADGDGAATLVGVAHHVRVFQPASPSTLDTAIAGLTDDLFNEATVRAARTGWIQLSIPGELEIRREVPGLAGSFDYLGLNYYTRDHVRADLGTPSLSNLYVPARRPTNDLGWDLYPEGLYRMIQRFSAAGWPILITENGIADETGLQRPAYLRSHVYALEQAVKDGADVRGYFHWSLLDNFEWAHGYGPRFGLYRTQLDSPGKERVPTPAVETFRDLARNLGLAPTP